MGLSASGLCFPAGPSLTCAQALGRVLAATELNPGQRMSLTALVIGATVKGHKHRLAPYTHTGSVSAQGCVSQLQSRH